MGSGPDWTGGVFSSFAKLSGFDFVDYDDRVGLLENLAVRKLDLVEIFSSRNNELYYPLTLLTYALEHSLFGLNSTVFHLDSILIHIANTVLLYFLMIRCFRVSTGGAVAAALILAFIPCMSSRSPRSRKKRMYFQFSFFSRPSTFTRNTS